MYVRTPGRLSSIVAIAALFLIHVAAIFLIIGKRVAVVALVYENQRLEKHCQDLVKERQLLFQQLCQAKDKMAVKEFAQKELGMERSFTYSCFTSYI